MELDKKNNTIKYTQNFLINKHLVEELINKTDISSQDFLIEIGPGKGILTEALKKKAKNV
jgi:23S rRNA (adenine-N6)-dimethyltransferase